jgi:hypothetical protein
MTLTRLEPALPVHSYKTYSISAPLATHWRPGTCEEADCPHYLHGWKTIVDESTDLGQRQAHYIRHDRTRKHTETRTEAGLTEFEFEPGQTCFAQHKVPIGRPELFLVRGGDWRGNPSGELRRHTKPEFWVEDFGEHQQKIADRLEQG